MRAFALSNLASPSVLALLCLALTFCGVQLSGRIVKDYLADSTVSKVALALLRG